MASSPVISIVDDDDSVRESTNALVRSLGYVTATFASAEEFLESGRVHDTSCLITDVHMPGMDGIELQSRLTADGHRLPVIFVTASPDAQARTAALVGGAAAFLSKPLGDEILISSLDQALVPGRP